MLQEMLKIIYLFKAYKYNGIPLIFTLLSRDVENVILASLWNPSRLTKKTGCRTTFRLRPLETRDAVFLHLHSFIVWLKWSENEASHVTHHGSIFFFLVSLWDLYGSFRYEIQMNQTLVIYTSQDPTVESRSDGRTRVIVCWIKWRNILSHSCDYGTCDVSVISR